MKRLAPLHDAAAKGQLILARVLLALGPDPKGASGLAMRIDRA
jgi:hypothetical protein